MKYFSKIFAPLLVVIILAACKGKEAQRPEAAEECAGARTAVYYWRTTFDIDSAEAAFIERHKIGRIYLRMFDVATERDFLSGASEIVPIATTQFASPPAADIEIVPVVYITIDALREMNGREAEYGALIAKRLLAMASYNKCGTTREIQLDCDWTASTRESYHNLCRRVRDKLAPKGIELSVTIRLHQLCEAPPPAHRGGLMLYNTGAIKNPDTRNSILHIDDVRPYIRNMRNPIPLDYIYPLFGWGVKFKDNKFVSIVPDDSVALAEKEYIRYERAAAADILEVKKFVEEHLGPPASGNILYHLDYSQLKNYTNDEISKILSH